MKLISKVSILLLTIITISPVTIAQEHEHSDATERFEKMDQMMEQMRRSDAPMERRDFMLQHMQLMQEQMQSMVCMMGNGEESSCPSGDMGMGMMGNGEGLNRNMPMHENMNHMAQHMEMMHNMMGQMLNHHQMMLEMYEIGHGN